MAGIDIGKFFHNAIHVKPATLKGTSFIKRGKETEAADAINAITAPLAEAALVAFPAVAAGALHVRPEQLHGVPHITDHIAAAAAINDHIEEVLKPK